MSSASPSRGATSRSSGNLADDLDVQRTRPDGVGTILVSRQPFTDAQLDTLEREAARLKFDVAVQPRGVLDQTFARLTDGGDIGAFLDNYPFNISAPTDDSPFFFNMLRMRDIGARRCSISARSATT